MGVFPPTEGCRGGLLYKGRMAIIASDNQKTPGRPSGPGREEGGLMDQAVKSHLEGIKFGGVQRHRNVAV